MKKVIMLIGAVSTISLVGCEGGDSDNTSESTQSTQPSQVEYHPYDAPAISENLKNNYLTAINNARAVGRSCGSQGNFDPAPALIWSDALYRSSYEHSEDMATANYTAHNGSGETSDWTSQILELERGSTPSERIINNGGSAYNGENIYWGKGSSNYTSVSAAIKWWLGSDGHCANLMSPNWVKVGMARVDTNSADWDSYWTQNFSN